MSVKKVTTFFRAGDHFGAHVKNKVEFVFFLF